MFVPKKVVEWFTERLKEDSRIASGNRQHRLGTSAGGAERGSMRMCRQKANKSLR